MCGHNSLVHTEHNNFTYCFQCTYQPDKDRRNVKPFSLADYGVSVDDVRGLYTHCVELYQQALQPEHIQYLVDRGYTKEYITTRAFGYCGKMQAPIYATTLAKASGLARENDTAQLAHCITFPYRDAQGNVTDIRGRSLIPDTELRYISCRNGATARGAIYPYNYDLISQNRDRFVVAEGEIKADISTLTGIQAIGTAGMNTHRAGIADVCAGRDVVICFDSQPDMATIYQAIKQQAAKYREYGARVSVCVLPHNNTKVDIDSYILEYGAARYVELIDSAVPYQLFARLVR